MGLWEQVEEFKKESDVIEEIRKESQADNKARFEDDNGEKIYTPWRFFLKNKTGTKLTVLPFEPKVFFERKVPKAASGRDRHNYETVPDPKTSNDDPFTKCPTVNGLEVEQPRRTYMMFVIDHAETTSGDKTYKDQLRLLPVKDNKDRTLGKIAYFSRIIKDMELENLDCTVFTANRSSMQSALTIGDEWQYIKKVTPEDLEEAYPEQMAEARRAYAKMDTWFSFKGRDRLIHEYNLETQSSSPPTNDPKPDVDKVADEVEEDEIPF